MAGHLALWPSLFVKGWDGVGSVPEWVQVLDAEQALQTPWAFDAQMVCYYQVNGTGGAVGMQPRLNVRAKSVIERAGYQLVCDVMVIDVDCPNSHQDEGAQPASEQWWLEEWDKLRRLPWFETMGWYRTWGGYRLVWLLAEPMEVGAWALHSYRFQRELRKWGVLAEKRKAWNKSMRLPFVRRDLRDKGYGVEDLRLPADFSMLGYLDWVFEPDGMNVLEDLWNEGEGGGGESLPEVLDEMRNDTLFRLACSDFHKGRSRAEVLIAIGATNRLRCKPPLEQDELEALVDSAEKYGSGNTILGSVPVPEGAPVLDGSGDGGLVQAGAWGPPPDDAPLQRGDEVELAERVLQIVESTLAWQLVCDEGALWAYQESLGLFEPLEDARIERIVWKHAGCDVEEGVYKTTGEPKVRTLKINNRTAMGVRSIVHKARMMGNFFADAPAGASFTNGFVSLTGWGDDAALALGAAGPGWRSRFGYDFEYASGLAPVRYLSLLRSCFEGDQDAELKIEVLREYLGACILGIATEFEQALVLLGERARNGKSQVLEIWKGCFPEGTRTSVPPQDLVKQDRRAQLAGARLNLVSEMPAGDILATDMFKKMISGEMTNARALYKDPFDFKPIAGHVIAANILPRPRKDFTEGFWRRWKIVRFNRRFLPAGQAGAGDGVAVIGIGRQVVAAEKRQIVCWAVDGVVAAARRGEYLEVPSSRSALSKWRMEADPVALFVSDKLVDSGEWMALADIYRVYMEWCIENGHGSGSKTTLANRLRMLGVPNGRDGKVSTKFRVRLKGK